MFETDAHSQRQDSVTQMWQIHTNLPWMFQNEDEVGGEDACLHVPQSALGYICSVIRRQQTAESSWEIQRERVNQLQIIAHTTVFVCEY